MTLHREPTNVTELLSLLTERRFAVLTGAGCSTESGIPDYRGPETRRRARHPIRWSAYMADPRARRRYWARSILGWPRLANATPNDAHRAIAALEGCGRISGLITQNVDRLHTVAGSRNLVELHGALAEVNCLECGSVEHRDELQARLLALNPGFPALLTRVIESAPDGDAEFDDDQLSEFVVADCRLCRGTLKPNVVFFGENVPRPRVDQAMSLLECSEGLLVVGSSLTVFSGYRFVLRAAERRLPIAIVNLGTTRGDEHACVKVDGRAGDVLRYLAARLAIR